MAFPTRTQTLSDPIVATVDTYIKKTPADVIFNQNLLLGTLWASGKMRNVAGPAPTIKTRSPRVFRQAGREFWIPVNQARSTNTAAFRHLDTLPTAIDEGLTTQRSLVAYYQDYAAMSWQEMKENSGPDAVLDIWKSRVDRAFNTLAESIETDLFSANLDTSATQKEVIGLQTLVSTGPSTGTVWNINRATYSWQQNQATGSVGSFATGGLAAMVAMLTDVSGTNSVDRPTLILTTPTIWEAAVTQLEAVHRIVNENSSPDLSFPAVRYQGIPIVYSSNTLSGAMYFLNLDYFRLLMVPGADFDTVTPTSPNDQLVDKQIRILWAGNWGCERFDRQGVLSGITA